MTEVDRPHPIPEHWTWRRLDQVGEVRSGSTPSTSEGENFGGDIPWLTPNDLSGFEGKYVRRGERNLTKRGLDACSAVLLPSETVLFSSRAPIGYAAIAANPIATNQGFKNLIPGDTVESEYVYHYLKGNTALAERYASGTTFKELSATRFSRIPIPLPPRSEQRRIVSKIEELFSNLEAGVDSLQTAKRKLERYRLSVLQAAVEGRLTAEWRRTHNPEPADWLLEQILKERQEQWEERYRWQRYESKGKEPPIGWRDRYKASVDPKGPPQDITIPESWIWASVDQVGHVETGSTPKTSVEDNYGGPYPFFRPGDLDAGYRISESDKTLTQAGVDAARPLPPLSTLVTCIGASIGKTAITATRGATNQQINAIAPFPSIIPEFVYLVAESPYFQSLVKSRASSTTMPILNKTKFASLPFPLPPTAEQRAIVNETQRLISVADRAMETFKQELMRSKRLRQSIIKQAFTGHM